MKYSETILGVTSFFFLLFSLTITNAVVSYQTDYDNDTTSNPQGVDTRRYQKVKESTITLKFFAQDICNENVGKNGLCLDIWGKGSASANAITANGSFETYRGKPVDFNKGKWLQLNRGHWSAVDLLTVTEKEISFKASTSSKIVFIELTEGKAENSGQVCVYGPLIAVQKAEDAVCVKNAFVAVEKTS